MSSKIVLSLLCFLPLVISSGPGLPEAIPHKTIRIFAPDNRTTSQKKPSAANFWEPEKKNTSVDTASLKKSNWYADAVSNIAEMEYEIKYDSATRSYASPNRKRNLRSFYTPGTFTLLPHNLNGEQWKLQLTTMGIYTGSKKIYSPLKNAAVIQNKKTIQFSHNNGFITEYVNSSEGVRQNFIINKDPHQGDAGASAPLSVKLKANKNWRLNKLNDQEIHFEKRGKTGIVNKIVYNNLKAWDANNTELTAFFEVKKDELSIMVDASQAVYPVTIDPLSQYNLGFYDSSPDDANQANANLGVSVSGAGDVNGDGYSDVIIGANKFDNGANTDEGRAFLYYGSINGLASSPASLLNPTNQAGAEFGISVSTAGDINRDGYSDVIIGAHKYNDGFIDEGNAFVYYGSATGLGSSPNRILNDANQSGCNFGFSVACAGDVNGDGYSDVAVGAPFFDDAANTDEGRVFVYYGSATGLGAAPGSLPNDADQAGAEFGYSVAGAGDVNGDGFSDIIIGAPMYDNGPFSNEGFVFIYHGSAAGLFGNATSILHNANQAGAEMGFSVSSAGDINGDGYSDVIMGAPLYTNGAAVNAGRTFVHLGSPAGVVGVASFVFTGTNSLDQFGYAVSTAGDVNGDGYGDVIIGSPFFDDVAITDEGNAFVYFGSATGLGISANSTPNDANQSGCNFGLSVACAGDVNGDGFSDLIIGAPGYDDGANSNEGRSFIYHGNIVYIGSTIFQNEITTAQVTLTGDNQTFQSFGCSVSSAGDINADGYDDVIIGESDFDNGANTNEGRAFVFYGSATGLSTVPGATYDDANQAGAFFGKSVACAGDVNGDGFSDVIIGASEYDDGSNPAEGRAYLYYGSSTGLAASPSAILDDANQAGANFGSSVAGAGDVNRDGYSDVIIGAYYYNSGYGAAFVYYGSATGPGTTPNIMLADPVITTGAFGVSVAGAGDVNGDGFGDVIVGSYLSSHLTQVSCGAAYIYHGSGTGLTNTPAIILFDAGQPYCEFGRCVAGVGDINGDGYSDVAIGAPGWDATLSSITDNGAVFIHYGSAAGINSSYQFTIGGGTGGSNGYIGSSVAGAGDLNGDGYSDLIIGAPGLDVVNSGGLALVFFGSSSGINVNLRDYKHFFNLFNSSTGGSVASAGDVNGDGLSDVLIGAPGASASGKTMVCYGNESIGSRNNIRLYNTNLTTPIQQSNYSSLTFGLGLYASSPMGREKGKLVWEVKGAGQPFSGSIIGSSTAFTSKQIPFTNLGLTGAELKNLIQKVGGAYNKVRVRVEYDKATSVTGQVYGPWRYPQGYLRGALGMNSNPIPVTLLSFTAVKQANDVLVRWQTSNEQNVNRYEVEKSIDGIRFEKTGTVAAGNTGNAGNYQFIDNAPWLSELRYYRLKSIDNDGQFKYSTIVRISNKQTGLVSIYPNPAKDVFTINAPDNSLMNTQATLSGINGGILKTIVITHPQETVNVSTLPAGFYMLRFENGTVVKLIKE